VVELAGMTDAPSFSLPHLPTADTLKWEKLAPFNTSAAPRHRFGNDFS
jgi:hypothetical protein